MAAVLGIVFGVGAGANLGFLELTVALPKVVKLELLGAGCNFGCKSPQSRVGLIFL
jgi:hypothetical protein